MHGSPRVASKPGLKLAIIAIIVIIALTIEWRSLSVDYPSSRNLPNQINKNIKKN